LLFEQELANKFWEKVYDQKQKDNQQILATGAEKIIIFFDEASSLLYDGDYIYMYTFLNKLQFILN
jgi:hypothetical protein